MQSLSEYPEKLSSLGEVQRIIGLSLSKIQIGRNQRGGLPLHKNLLVATVLNKARDLYMQETMYMNYKMMTGHQFGMPASTSEGTSSLTNVPGNSREEEMEEPPEHEDYEEDSESDVEDECEPRSCDLAASPRAAIAASMAYPASTMAAMMMQAAAASVAASSCSNEETGRLTPINPSAIAMQNNMRLHHQTNSDVNHSSEDHQSSQHDFTMHGSFQHLHHLSQLHHHHQQQQQQQLQLQQEQHQQTAAIVAAHAQAAVVAAAAAVVSQQHLQQQQQQQQQVNTPVTGSDEGFIDEPDCDCDVRNFSTLETRVPFQYCYHCAPFQSANGRGPTLVPSPSSCPTSLSSSNTSNQVEDDSTRSTLQHQSLSSFQASSQAASETDVSSCQQQQQQQQQQCSENNFTIYDMDSKSTERKAPCDEPSRPGTKRRRKTSGPEIADVPKRRRSSEGNDLDVGTEDQQPLLSSTSTTSSTTSTFVTSDSRTEEDEVVHPAFRNSHAESNAVGHQAMEIDQITSLVSIFSFGQHIIAVGRGKDNSTTTTTTTTSTTTTSDNVAVEVKSSETESGSEDKSEDKKSSAEDDSDSESDTSSDSGHSSDDHDTSSDKDIKDEDEKTSDVVLTKLTRSASTPDLCSASVSASNGAMTSESPLCVEVASV